LPRACTRIASLTQQLRQSRSEHLADRVVVIARSPARNSVTVGRAAAPVRLIAGSFIQTSLLQVDSTGQFLRRDARVPGWMPMESVSLTNAIVELRRQWCSRRLCRIGIHARKLMFGRLASRWNSIGGVKWGPSAAAVACHAALLTACGGGETTTLP
jgi:hypothetical protein